MIKFMTNKEVMLKDLINKSRGLIDMLINNSLAYDFL